MPWEKQFDVDVALQKAGEAFWSHGYEVTSVNDLLVAMGIQKGSFYDTYGSKKEAYLRALDQYTDTRFAQFRKSVEQQAPRRSLEMHLDEIFQECIGADGYRGCMAINCALELAHSDKAAQKAVLRAFNGHEKFLFEHIEAAQAAGELSAEIDAVATAKAMFAMVMGMRVYSRAGAPKAALRTLADQALALLDR